MKLYTKVIPNFYNEVGCVIIIYEKVWFWKVEIGRVKDDETLKNFMKTYAKHNRKIVYPEQYMEE